MRTIPYVICATLGLALWGCAYNPALPDEPFICGPGGKCPDGYSCYGGICRKTLPACMDPRVPMYALWPNDADLEPNNHPDLAVTLPCGDNPTIDPAAYQVRCGDRINATNGYMNLVICPEKDRDLYKIFLQQDEALAVTVLYKYGDGLLPRDLNAKIWRWDYAMNLYIEVTLGMSTNDNENLTVSTDVGSGNPPGWYFIEVHGATDADVNFYSLQFTLNPPPP